MAKPGGHKRSGRADRFLEGAAILGIWVASGAAMVLLWPAAIMQPIDSEGGLANLNRDYAKVAASVQQFEQEQSQTEIQVIPAGTLQRRLAGAQIDVAAGWSHQAVGELHTLSMQLVSYRQQLQEATVVAPDDEDSSTPGSLFLPVLFYHDPPSDLAQQLQFLQQHNYTVIDMRQAEAGLEGGPLPLKPVVITFDDGYETQWQAFELLKQYHMKATFFIIDGGPNSNWCIGAGRKYHLPSQPLGGCGDAYLSWDQVRTLDRSGLITIGGHTIDHPDLPTLSVQQQTYEIATGKQILEKEIGHKIYDFAYPYGDYDSATEQIVRAAGYQTAVTTQDGAYQPPGSEWTLARIRSVWELPQ